jgi:TRAP transporter 4TM/12TM fusion protein
VFILATITGTGYLTIAAKNIIPALLFFTFLIMMVDLGALKAGLKGLPAKEVPKTSEVLKKGWFFILPIVAILTFLFMGFTPDFAAFWGTISAFAVSWIRKETRMYPKDVLFGLVKGARSNMSAGSAIGSLGLIIGGIVLAGLGLKFSAILVQLAGGSLLLTMLMVLLISIIIGMGSTTTGSYIILSVVAAPALVTLGVPLVAAHLVVFYGACLSNITPPVCVSVFAASAIAQSEPMETGFSALKYGMVLILLPFGFVYYPGLLLNASVGRVVYVVVFIIFGLIAMAMALQGADFLNHSIKTARRIFFGVALLIIGWIPSIGVYRKSRLENPQILNSVDGV